MTWRRSVLGDHLDILSGFAFKSQWFNADGRGLPLIRIRDVVPGKSDTYYSGPYQERYVITDGDLLIGMDGEFNRARWRGGRALLNQRVCKVSPSNGSLDERYLFHVLPQVLKAIEDKTPFVTVKHLSVNDLREVELFLPPISEQGRIAAILDRADGIRRKRVQTHAMANELLRSAFLNLFGDPLANPHGFPTEEIAFHLSKQRTGTQSGPFGSALKKHEYTRAGIPVWGVDNVQQNEFVNNAKLFISEGKFDQLQRYAVEAGDILISRAGTVGRMCIATPTVAKSIISTNLIRVVLDKSSLLPEYFVALFTYFPHRLGALKANNKDNAFTFLNPRTLKTIEIPIPPIELQEKYRRFSQAVERQMSLEREHLAGLKTLFASLSQRAFGNNL
ncbi:restriction endonuclease subunit S [Bradyrhizobium sp. 26S5]|uniref:restriction endonuclease subunit S n=1 Tax=Bradyrhizobium sp. 26S5 TaxID=3139729 RepID=UPI0030CD2D1B